MTELQQTATNRIAQLRAEMNFQLRQTEAYYKGRIDEVEALLKASTPPGPVDGDAAQVIEAAAN